MTTFILSQERVGKLCDLLRNNAYTLTITNVAITDGYIVVEFIDYHTPNAFGCTEIGTLSVVTI